MKLDVNEIAKPRGTRDMLPSETRNRRKVDDMIRETLAQYSFEEIQTPIFEYLSLFMLRSGEKIKDDMYWFSPPSAEQKVEQSKLEYCLRPELTAATCRFYVSGGLSNLPKPIKVFYSGPCFRYDTPAPGRYREFYQVGVELIGSDSPKADAEVVTLATAILNALGIRDYKVQINDISIFRALLDEFEINVQNKVLGIIDKYGSTLAKFRLGVFEEGVTEATLMQEYKEKLTDFTEGALLSILVKLINIRGGREVLEDVKKLVGDYPNAMKAIEESSLNDVFRFLELSGVDNAIIDFSIARGLDYYTGIVFEIDVESLKGAKQICGGGRYDNLITEYGGDPTPATGFAFGFDRLVIAYENARREQEIQEIRGKCDVYVVMIKPDPEIETRTVLACRKAGLRTEFNLSGRSSMKAKLTYAQKIRAPFTIIQGPKEIEKGTVVLRDMGVLSEENRKKDENKDKYQEEMSLDEAITRVKSILGIN